MNIQFLILWVLMLLTGKNPQTLADPAFLKNEMQQLQQRAPNNLLVQLISGFLADLNNFLLFLQKMLLSEQQNLANVTPTELQTINNQLQIFPFAEVYAAINRNLSSASATESEILKNYERIIQILENTAQETQQLLTQRKKAAFFELLSELQNSEEIDEAAIIEEVETVRKQRYAG